MTEQTASTMHHPATHHSLPPAILVAGCRELDWEIAQCGLWSVSFSFKPLIEIGNIKIL